MNNNDNGDNDGGGGGGGDGDGADNNNNHDDVDPTRDFRQAVVLGNIEQMGRTAPWDFQQRTHVRQSPPFHDAVIRGDIRTVRIFLKANGLDCLETKNAAEKTPLDIARVGGDEQARQLDTDLEGRKKNIVILLLLHYGNHIFKKHGTGSVQYLLELADSSAGARELVLPIGKVSNTEYARILELLFNLDPAGTHVDRFDVGDDLSIHKVCYAGARTAYIRFTSQDEASSRWFHCFSESAPFLESFRRYTPDNQPGILPLHVLCSAFSADPCKNCLRYVRVQSLFLEFPVSWWEQPQKYAGLTLDGEAALELDFFLFLFKRSMDVMRRHAAALAQQPDNNGN